MMRAHLLATLIALTAPVAASAQSQTDSALAVFIKGIRAVDNHTHVNSLAPHDTDSDALPLDGLPPGPTAVRIRADNATLVTRAYRELYGYAYDDLTDLHLTELRGSVKQVMAREKNHFPTWVLDRIGVEVMVGNRIAMGPGLDAPRFRWASYVDALILPLSNVGAATTPDQRVLYPLEDKLLRRYLSDLHLAKVPATLDAYLKTVVTPTLEQQQKGGCVAVKFEAAYLRSLDFDDASLADARRIYARYAGRGVPTRAEYKTLQDYLFRYIARESGRLGMAVHIHSLEGGGSYYRIAGSDPLLLEPAFNDSSLRKTNFVIVHGGGIYYRNAGAMLSKGNVYLDMSAMSLIYDSSMLANILHEWLTQYPEKVLFGTDAFTLGPDAGWEVTAWLGTTTAREALTIALTRMMRDGEITRERAEELAMMVLRTNAGTLYGLFSH
jgi:predicted TIM-barrel fold metal-dependent hydrolase